MLMDIDFYINKDGEIEKNTCHIQQFFLKTIAF